MPADYQRDLDAVYPVQLNGLTKAYGQVTALNDITVGFRTGSVTAVLGLSGSGKSTLLSHINGMATPTRGTVRVLGHEVNALRGRPLRRLRRDVGMIFQSFNLVGPMSVLENVCTGALGRLRGPRISLMMYPRAVREEAMANLERVGLSSHAHQRADTLSGGQQQRVAIARALMQHPRILLADEPVASLDPVSAQEVMGLITHISREDDLTVIMSLHQVQLALDVAQRVIGLRGGHLVLDQRTDTLTAAQASQIYSAVASTQTAEVPAQ
ncbi:phosphonate ABC transporter ATP-binding protein [Corynebacterium uberis]|uniref:phosphonate ABC transporter ATP-binding protein n=1 Tax=Corynebacterium TaxID=1716 RepID=UPI001D0B1EE9|nr:MULTISPECIES: phosphonate ABC transporter ATP-binding protein [Corynebacterium]MCZ9308848.1 phosphonate ABC transporter ATP-binding protein [Corynebacterium sp. c6VSa_13]UDL74737.1 phosphonate ABC transporter ATP-binding protein [Corynebacterium uberis]UDL76917.1 phosphonate ABC transporter ATP-binding protein [Corynebacterium uberis]UDL79128.1 phosphonate ABC transporter ATP-binding protein [Corynebacterium uberis]UDL81332.1 phosphonate ABC transporter ATP-binding protein [Corynebacterium 